MSELVLDRISREHHISLLLQTLNSINSTDTLINYYYSGSYHSYNYFIPTVSHSNFYLQYHYYNNLFPYLLN